MFINDSHSTLSDHCCETINKQQNLQSGEKLDCEKRNTNLAIAHDNESSGVRALLTCLFILGHENNIPVGLQTSN